MKPFSVHNYLVFSQWQMKVHSGTYILSCKNLLTSSLECDMQNSEMRGSASIVVELQ